MGAHLEEPLALLCRSGDVIVMGGDSRLRYHGVPRVLGGTYPEQLQALMREEAGGAKSNQPTNQLMEGVRALNTIEKAVGHPVRLNINVRQVLAPGQRFPGGDKGTEGGAGEPAAKRAKPAAALVEP